MMTFREFLEKKAAEEHHLQRTQQREEWVAAVKRLLEQIRIWVAEADPQGILSVIPFEIERAEPDLGVYRVPALRIGLGDAAVEIRPLARKTHGFIEARGEASVPAEGRVDIVTGGRQYILYRSLLGGRETWYALDDKFRPCPLDRAELEAILQDLLS